MSMNSGKLFGLVIATAGCAIAAYGSANVFDDAVFWFRGGKDCVTADGQLELGEFFNDLQAHDPSHDSHKCTVYGYPENRTFRTEGVVFPALGTACAKQMQVLNISDNKRVSNDLATTNRWPAVVNPYTRIFKNNNISNEYTIVFRLRLDSQSEMWLFKAGYDGNAKTGLLFGFTKDTSHDGCVYAKGYGTQTSGGSNGGIHFNSVFVPTNTWMDIAVVVGNGKVRVGAAAPSSLDARGKNPAIVFQQRALWTDNCVLSSNAGHYLLFGQSQYSTQPATPSGDNFKGSVQQIAVWKRALSDQEVMAAFGMPRPALFRTGFDNGASDEFGGTRSGTTQTIEGLGSWQGVSDTMLAGDTWTVNFDGLRDEAGLPQIFSLRSLQSSSSASLDVSVNGTPLGTRYVGKGGCAYWPVASNIVVQGANSAVIRRVDGGAGVFRLDSMELGGSVGVGIMDMQFATDGTSDPLRMSGGVPSASDPNPQHWSRNLWTYQSCTNVHFRVWVDPAVAEICPGRFRTRTLCSHRSNVAPYLIVGDEYFSLKVNGAEKATRDCSRSWETMTIDFAPGELHGGWNDIEMITASSGTCYWIIDYYRFETFLNKGFSHPQSGTFLIAR